MCSRCNGVAVAWLEQAAAEVPADDGWLGERERAVLRGLRFAKRRGDWRLGRWTAKRAVAAALELSEVGLRDIEILAAANGAPEAWIGGERALVSLSLSHSAGHALCCVARGEIALGCDVECIEGRSDSFAADYLADDERRALGQLPPGEQAAAINLYWSAKESALKALGEGLRLDTRSVYVEAGGSVSAPGWRQLRVTHESGRVFEGWWQCSGGFVRTMVAAPALAIPQSACGVHGS